MPNSAVAKSLLRLEREVYATSGHAEVIMRAIDDVPAEVINPADVPGESDLESSANLAHHPTFPIAVSRDECGSPTGGNNLVFLAAAEDSTEAAEHVGREARTADRITQGQRP